MVKRKCRENNDYVTQVCLTAKRDKDNTKYSDYTRNSNINGFIEEGMENEAKEVFAGYKYGKEASERESHKGIIIGKGGSMLKKISTFAREDMEKFFGIKVNLRCWVKVKEDWRNREGLIHNFGLD